MSQPASATRQTPLLRQQLLQTYLQVARQSSAAERPPQALRPVVGMVVRRSADYMPPEASLVEAQWVPGRMAVEHELPPLPGVRYPARFPLHDYHVGEAGPKDIPQQL